MTTLRILLEYGHFLDVSMPEYKAREVLRAWASGELRLKGATHLSADDWSVPLDRVVAVHLVNAPPRPVSALSGTYRSN